jgi:transposase
MIAYRKLKSLRKTSALVGISKSTISRWTNSSPSIQNAREARKVTAQCLDAIKTIIQENPFTSPDLISKQIKQSIGVSLSPSCVRFWMKRVGFSRKKAHRYVHKDGNSDIKVSFAKSFSSQVDPSRVVSIDESSFYFDMKPSFGYSYKSTRLRVKASTGGRTRYSLLMAVTNNRIVGWHLQKGSINSVNFQAFVATLDVDGRDFLLMDNASIHKTENVINTLNSRGLTPCFLPPYTPEFQPIEHCFSVIKSNYRYQNSENATAVPDLTNVTSRVRMASFDVSAESLSNMFSACWKRSLSYIAEDSDEGNCVLGLRITCG